MGADAWSSSECRRFTEITLCCFALSGLLGNTAQLVEEHNCSHRPSFLADTLGTKELAFIESILAICILGGVAGHGRPMGSH
jgi:hypothetical protein